MANNFETNLVIDNQFKYMQINKTNEGFVAILVDYSGYEIIKGYGNTALESINDMHSNLF